MTVRTETTKSLTDVAGVRVGHMSGSGDGWLSGSTVVLAPEGGVVAGVDVRGGGSGTRETDLLDPRNFVERIHAAVLSGGSAFGLAGVDGVMERFFAAGVGLPMGSPGEVVPIVPGAVIFDMGRGGDYIARPDRMVGEQAYDSALSTGTDRVAMGVVGAGTGAKAGGLKGGIGSASVVLEDGTTVGALVVVNPFGSCVDPATGELYATRFGLAGEFPMLVAPSEQDLAAARKAAEDVPSPSGARPGLATTIGVVATDATLTKAQCAKVSGIAHDGMARAIRPMQTMFDEDTVFTMATCSREAPDTFGFHALLEAAGDFFTLAIGHAILAAETVETPAGRWRSYRDAYPSAFHAIPEESDQLYE